MNCPSPGADSYIVHTPQKMNAELIKEHLDDFD